MTHPSIHAQTHPDKAAFIMAGTGETVTYRQLDERSNQGAHLFRSLGLKPGDSIACFIDNHPRYFEIIWAAQRSGRRRVAGRSATAVTAGGPRSGSNPSPRILSEPPRGTRRPAVRQAASSAIPSARERTGA